MKNKLKIGILGCGWLGTAVARKLIEDGHNVKGSVTSSKGTEELKNLSVEPYVIQLVDSGEIENLKTFLVDLEVLVISIPPKTRQSDFSLIASLQNAFKQYDFSKLKKLIYISSTGVFQDDINVFYDEDSTPNNTSERGKVLIELENFILNKNLQKSIIIIRYGGLIEHGGRHPIHYLAGKKDIPNPEGAINLIERSDAANLLLKVIENDKDFNVYHGVNPNHPTRENYYTSKAKELDLSLPEFESSKPSKGKTILSEKTQKHLNFIFKSNL